MNRVILPVRIARRLPDPVFPSIERHILYVAVVDIPGSMPKDPNPRKDQDVDHRIWVDIRKHLMNEDGTPNSFHLKNKGMTVFASAVTKLADDRYEISLEEGDGTADGGHTYELLQSSLNAIVDFNQALPEGSSPINQFVRVEVVTGVPNEMMAEIAGGLNTAIQVQKMSLAELRDEFKWIKDELAGHASLDFIAFRENEDKPFDARDVVVLLDLFNTAEFPNAGNEHPVRAYSSKAAVLDNYLLKAKRKNYEALRPILRDILELHDIISMEGPKLHNEAGGKAGSLSWIEQRSRGTYHLPFLNKSGGTMRLGRATLFPMLAAFRWMVQSNPRTGELEWRGGFDAVKDLWRKVGGELMRATQDQAVDVGRRPNAIGKSRNHWNGLYNIVAAKDLIASRSAAR